MKGDSEHSNLFLFGNAVVRFERTGTAKKDQEIFHEFATHRSEAPGLGLRILASLSRK
jgi:hypothetical protein